MANVTPSLVLQELQQPDASAFTTAAAVAIPANQVTLLAVDAAGTSSVAAPTISQTGVTWEFVSTSSAGATTNPAVHLFRAAPATAANATITATFGETKTSCCFTVVTCANSRAGNNGADALGTATHTEQASGSSISVTLPTLAAATSAAVGFFRQATAGSGQTVGSGITSLANTPGTAPSSRHIAMWKQNATLLDMSSVSNVTRLIGIEVKAVSLDSTVTDAVGITDSASIERGISVQPAAGDPVVVQRAAAAISSTTSHSVTLTSTPTPGNVLVAVWAPKTSGYFPGTALPPPNWVIMAQATLSATASLVAVARTVGPGTLATVTFDTTAAVTSEMEVFEVAGVNISDVSAVHEAFPGSTASFAAYDTGPVAPPLSWGLTASATVADNGGAEAVSDGFAVRDAATFSTMIVADKITSGTDTLEPVHSWTTARTAYGFVLYFARAGQTVGIVDSATVASDLAVGGTDAMGISDSAVAGLVLSSVAADVAGITDSAVVEMFQTIDVSGTDPVGIVDSAVSEIQTGVLGTDAVGITDSASVASDLGAAATDAVGITDSAVVELGGTAHAVTGTDPVGITDSKVVEITTEGYPDPVGITDSAVVTLTPITAVAAANPVGITDSATVAMSYALAAADAIGVADSAATDRPIVLSVVDSIGVTDSALTGAAIDIVAVDVIGVGDGGAATGLGIEVSLVDHIGVVDGAATAMDYVLAILDAIEVTDAIVVGSVLTVVPGSVAVSVHLGGSATASATAMGAVTASGHDGG